MPQCEGWRRRGGAFSFGPPQWIQCENLGVVALSVEQDGETATLPACMGCWRESEAKGIVTGCRPLTEEESQLAEWPEEMRDEQQSSTPGSRVPEDAPRRAEG